MMDYDFDKLHSSRCVFVDGIRYEIDSSPNADSVDLRADAAPAGERRGGGAGGALAGARQGGAGTGTAHWSNRDRPEYPTEIEGRKPKIKPAATLIRART